MYVNLNMQYNMGYMQALLEEVKGRASSLTAVIASGRELEAYVQENGATAIDDIGYSRTEERYKTLEVNLGTILGTASTLYTCVYA